MHEVADLHRQLCTSRENPNFKKSAAFHQMNLNLFLSAAVSLVAPLGPEQPAAKYWLSLNLNWSGVADRTAFLQPKGDKVREKLE